MIHRQNNVLANSSGPAFGASYTVHVCPVGAVASAGSSGITATVDRGHGFAALDKVLVWSSSAGTFVAEALASVTDTTLVWSAATPTIVLGDLLVNLGPDTASGSTPAYDGFNGFEFIYSDADGTVNITDNKVTCNATGDYDYHHRGDGKVWELFRTSAGVVAGVVDGHGGDPGRLNVCDYGSIADGGTECLTRTQACVNAARALQSTAGSTIKTGGRVFFPLGKYIHAGTLVLPRAEQTTHPRAVWLEGETQQSTIIQGTTGFSSGDAVIEWEATAFKAWDQRITNLTIVCPSTDGTHAIRYTPTLTSTWAEYNAEALTLVMENVEIEAENQYHASLIFLEGICRHCRFVNVKGDPVITSRVYDTMLFKFDTDPANANSNAFDEPGCNWGYFENIWTTPQRGGYCGLVVGRVSHSNLDICEVGAGNYADPVIDLHNSVGSTFNNVWCEGAGETPQVKLTDCRYVSFPKMMLGHPNDPGSFTTGNGIELVASTNCYIERVGDDTGYVSFDSTGNKLITLDANSHDNRIVVGGAMDITGTFVPEDEFTDSGTNNWITFTSHADAGVTDPYREFQRGGPRVQSVRYEDDYEGSMLVKSITEVITLSSGTNNHDSSGGMLPADSYILGVAFRCSVTAGGTITYNVGDDDGNPLRFSDVEHNATDGITGRAYDHHDPAKATTRALSPIQVAASEIRLTTNSNPSDSLGRVQITVYYMKFQSPQADL